MKKHRFLAFNIGFLGLILLINVLLKTRASWALHYYKDGFFSWIRQSYDFLFGQWLPFPFFILSFLALSFCVLIHISRKRKTFEKLSVGFGWIAFTISAFYVLWGFNYNVPSVSQLISLRFEKVDSIALYDELDYVIKEINYMRSSIQDDSFPISFDNSDLEAEIRHDLESTFENLNIKTMGTPRVRTVKPAGLLMRWKTAGIYIPHAFEGHIDGGLLPIEQPFTMAHEMSHAYGITGEGDCNFTAFLACMSSENPFFRYSAYLDYSLYLLRDVYRTNPSMHKMFRERLHPGYHADIKAMIENGKKYPDILPAVRDLLYDRYLKAQGIKDGIKNYSRMVQMVINYKAQFM